MGDFPPELIKALQEAEDNVLMDGYGEHPPHNTIPALRKALRHIAVLNTRAAARAKSDQAYLMYAAFDTVFSEIDFLLKGLEDAGV